MAIANSSRVSSNPSTATPRTRRSRKSMTGAIARNRSVTRGLKAAGDIARSKKIHFDESHLCCNPPENATTSAPSAVANWRGCRRGVRGTRHQIRGSAASWSQTLRQRFGEVAGEATKLLYRDYLEEKGLDPTELRGKNL